MPKENYYRGVRDCHPLAVSLVVGCKFRKGKKYFYQVLTRTIYNKSNKNIGNYPHFVCKFKVLLWSKHLSYRKPCLFNVYERTID